MHKTRQICINLRSMACVVGVLIYNSNLHVHEFYEGVGEGCCDVLHIFSLVSSTSLLYIGILGYLSTSHMWNTTYLFVKSINTRASLSRNF